MTDTTVQNPFSLGAVSNVSGGAETNLTANFADLANVGTSGLQVQASYDNTDTLWFGYAGMNTTTGAGVLAELGAGDGFAINSSAERGLLYRLGAFAFKSKSGTQKLYAFFYQK